MNIWSSAASWRKIRGQKAAIAGALSSRLGFTTPRKNNIFRMGPSHHQRKFATKTTMQPTNLNAVKGGVQSVE